MEVQANYRSSEIVILLWIGVERGAASLSQRGEWWALCDWEPIKGRKGRLQAVRQQVWGCKIACDVLESSSELAKCVGMSGMRAGLMAGKEEDEDEIRQRVCLEDPSMMGQMLKLCFLVWVVGNYCNIFSRSVGVATVEVSTYLWGRLDPLVKILATER